MSKVTTNEECIKTKPTAYVLMRIYFSSSELEEVSDGLITMRELLDKLNTALDSIKSNKKQYKGNVILLYNDDTPRGNLEKTYKEYKKALNQKLYAYLGDTFEETYKEDNEEPGGMGSSYSAYLVRELFLKKANEYDVAISLDQDDKLMDGAIANIVKHMPLGGIVVSPFRMEDSKHLDKTDDGGRIHNRTARRMFPAFRAQWISKAADRPLNEHTYKPLYFPWGCYELCALLKSVCKNVLVYFKRSYISLSNFFIGRLDISDLSSIGWTKSYSRKVLYQYHQDMKLFFYARALENGTADTDNPETCLKEFFSDHRAYEDFIDFYVLLFERLYVSGTWKASHTYIKNPKSITSTPSVEDFRDHRTACLIALIDMCYAKSNNELEIGKYAKIHSFGNLTPGEYPTLNKYFEKKLLRYVASKTCQIENLITSNIEDFTKNGKTEFSKLSADTHKAFFINKFSRLALGENRNLEQDKFLFRFTTSRSNRSKTNFEHLFSKEVFNNEPLYENLTEPTTPKYVLLKAADNENALRKKYLKRIKKDDLNEELLIGNVTPHENQKQKLIYIRAVFAFFLLCFIVCVSLGGNVIILSGEIIAAIIALCGVIMTLVSNEIGKVKVICEEEKSKAKLYYSEFYDLVRHLEANVRVMIQIRKEIIELKEKDSKALPIVQDIHFDNLRWPEDSILFSDEMAKLINRDRVDDFARLKVNIRNINNSAKWLEEQALSRTDMLEPLEWEITRYFGYLSNLYFFKNNSFHFPQNDELDHYLKKNAIINKLTTLFMSYKAEDRTKEVEYFIEKYFDDRRMKRSVLVK